ncbi:F-box protein At3g07870-like [Rhododendron vialii]|uniref:F-box protein At3g07870-like n=1 Tax=Rhododendron vialii TaxID=182163 RepID=UPI00265E8FAA|nr:F-box protein At3g07870-like [Rhododendron vialii]
MCSRELDSRVIVYFDLVEEKFKEVPPPSLWKKDDDMNLVVLGGFLCVYCDIGVKQIEVYAMKEYGKKESWTRLFVIPCVIDDAYLKPLCLTNKGQVLLSLWKMGIGIYDPEDGAFLPCGSDYGLTAIPYVESLVSLDGGDEMWSQHKAYPKKINMRNRVSSWHWHDSHCKGSLRFKFIGSHIVPCSATHGLCYNQVFILKFYHIIAFNIGAA